MPITERLNHDMKVLFIGFNPSLTSFATGFNYAGKSNRFYRVLFQSGLTKRQYEPSESPHLLEDYGYGFTNIVARPTKAASELTPEDYAEGRVILREKLETYRPLFACYVGKGVYQQFAKPKGTVPWGFQRENVVGGVQDFVAPSTSGLVRMTLADQTAIFQELAEALYNSDDR